MNTALVRRLIDTQFPPWASLPIRPVDAGGWDNSTFRLGDDMKVRLPNAAWYAPQVEKEHRWLPFLASRLPMPIPRAIAIGSPGEDYPHPWSIQSWIAGQPASIERIANLTHFALDLGTFLRALQAIPADTGPLAGPHSFFRGGPLSTYDAETRRGLDKLQNQIDARAARAMWEIALASQWSSPPVWVHGDFVIGNLLVRDGSLGAVIDFGCCATGDPACDLVIAWTFLTRESRATFRSAVSIDDATWSRARGWALWKALLMLADKDAGPTIKELARRTIVELTADKLG